MSSRYGTFFSGKVCLVTGGAQGLGWALSQALADHGASVHVCDISPESLENARAELASLPGGRSISFSRCDVTDPHAVERWISGIHHAQGRIDVLVNNAAFVKWADLAGMTLDDELRTMRVGYEGMVYCTRAVLPLMLQAGGGHIVNMGSSAGKIFAGAASAAYAATKAAIDGYTQTLQVELRGSPVRLTVVRPGTIAGTDFFRRHVPPQRLPRMGDFVPYLSPPEVASAILEAIYRKRLVLDIPRHLRLLYFFFEIAPGVLRKLATMGGSGRRDYGGVTWRYTWKESKSTEKPGSSSP